jgi:arginine utilization protein RocB
MSNSALNATKHGCCAVEAHLLPGESEKDLRNVERIWTEAYQPKSDYQKKLVTELVTADWLLQRTTKNYLEIETRLNAKSTNPLDWTEQEQRTLGRFLRYKTAHANTIARCRKALDDDRKSKLNEKAAAEKSALTQERIKVAQKKASPIVDWKQKLRDMRAQAVALGYASPNDPNPFDK